MPAIRGPGPNDAGKAYPRDRQNLRSGARGVALSGVDRAIIVNGSVLEKLNVLLRGELRGPGEALDGLAARGVGVSGVSR